MHAFTHLLSHTQSKIISWSNVDLTPLNVALKDTEAAIRSLEVVDSSDPDLTSTLMEYYTRFTSLQYQNSIRCAQRAHLLWLKDVDQNTTFFHNTICIHSHYNIIS